MPHAVRPPRSASPRKQRRHLRLEPLEQRQLLDGASTPSAATLGGPQPAAAPGDELLPDMFAWASESRGYVHGSYLDTSTQPGRKLLRFATAVANIGAGPMELRGGAVLPNGNQEVYQRVFKEGGGYADSLVGEFTYHASHQHIHFDGYANYHLRQALVDDGVGDIVASGGKVSFCLLDVTRYDTSAPSARYQTCGQNQGISVGWADVYTATLADQWIDVTDVPDGEYWLEIVIDPEDRLREADETNNVVRVRVSLGAGGELGDRFEANDTADRATDFGVVGDRSEADLSIHAPGNDDYYRLQTAADGTLDVTVSFEHDAGDIDIELLDADENVVDSSTSTDDTETLTYEVLADEVYYVRVFGYSSAVNPHYDLSIDGPDALVADPLEPNDDTSTATDFGELGSRAETGLSIHAAGNDDYFRFTTAANGQLEATVDFVHALGNLDVELLDADFQVVGSATSTTDNEQLLATVAGGETYYLRVFGRDGATNANYTLSIDAPLPSGSIAGLVWNDENRDGVRDASEPGLSGRLIYVDANGNGQFDSAPPASEEFSAAGLPLAIEDHAAVLSTIDVSGMARPIDELSLQLTLAHSYVGDLHVHLESPSGTRIELFSHVGGSGDDMTGTTLSDTAALSIVQGNAPFSGAFRPLRPLATFAGEDANGTWTLEIEDDEDGDTGSLIAWSLAIATEGYFEPTAFTAADGQFVISSLPPGEHTVAEQLPPDWEFTSPTAPATHTVMVAVDETASNVDFGNFYTPLTPARVVEVRLQRSNNSARYAIPSGDAAQLEPVPLVGLDQIAVVFDRPWNVAANDLELTGVANAAYTAVDAAFTTAPGDGGTFVATWTFAEPLEADRFLAVLHDVSTGDVHLDGEWTNPGGGKAASTFPSGNGQPGGDFAFRFNVLAGDANRDGQVDRTDAAHLAANGFVDAAQAGYDARHDLDGDGLVNVVDAVLASNRFGASLPSGEPELPASSPSPAAAAIVTRATNRPNAATPSSARLARASRREASAGDAASTDQALRTIALADAVSLHAARVRRASFVQ